ncbi:hypothetical protein HZB02_00545 [Candidatus Woesearchaeota archaeon]|nr:hypothetical protein [Candidatus Woesearchaeota archaeon]
MDNPFQPNLEENLTLVTLDRLLEGHLIEVLSSYPGEERRRYSELWNYARNVSFYVDSGTNLAHPLSMKLYTGNDLTLIPNQPIAALEFKQDAVMAVLPKFGDHRLKFPFGYELWNTNKSSAAQEPYFSAAESGWKHDEQGRFARAWIVVNSDQTGRPYQAMTTVRFTI